MKKAQGRNPFGRFKVFLDLNGIFISHLQMESFPGYLGFTREEPYEWQTSQSYERGELVSPPVLMRITKGHGAGGGGGRDKG